MKRYLIIALTIASTLSFATPLLAQTRVSVNSKAAREIIEISPFDLVTAGYQGRFINQGIPAASKFLSAVRMNKIDAQDLVEVAIAQRRLSSEMLTNKSYLSSVQSILDNQDRN